MTTNRLSAPASSSGLEHMTALEFAGEAIERGFPDKARLWLEEARRRGEERPSRYIQYNSDGTKRTIKTFNAKA